MTTTPDAPPLPGLFSRLIGVITSPGETFPHIVRTPKVLGALTVIGLLVGLSQGVPQLTERGKAAALDMQVQQIERFTGQPVSDEMYEGLRQRAQGSMSAITTIVTAPLGMAFVSVIITAVLWAVFNTIMGGTGTFKQVMAVVVHSQAISTLSALVAAPIMYARGQLSTTGIANLGALIPLDETSFIAKFFGMVDLFLIWWVVVLAIGLGALYKRSTSGIATGLLIFYGLVALALAYFVG